MGFLSFLGSFFSLISTWLSGRREDKLREEGKNEIRKEVAESNLQELERRIEAVNEEPKTSYSGNPSALADWVRKRRTDKE